MRRILFCASTASHLLRFHLPYLRAFREAGWEVWAASGTGESVPFANRSEALPLVKRPLSPRNAQAVLAARSLLARGRFDAVSVHTTLAAAAVRAAALTLRCRPKIFYTCHGYLFSESGSAPRRAASRIFPVSPACSRSARSAPTLRLPGRITMSGFPKSSADAILRTVTSGSSSKGTKSVKFAT